MLPNFLKGSQFKSSFSFEENRCNKRIIFDVRIFGLFLKLQANSVFIRLVDTTLFKRMQIGNLLTRGSESELHIRFLSKVFHCRNSPTDGAAEALAPLLVFIYVPAFELYLLTTSSLQTGTTDPCFYFDT